MADDAVTLDARDLSQLRWLAGQRDPVWGATPYDDPDGGDGSIRRWLDAGLIDRVSQPERGYRITAAGRAAVAEADRLAPPPNASAAKTSDLPPIRWLQTSPASRTLQVLHAGAWVDVPTVRSPTHGR